MAPFAHRLGGSGPGGRAAGCKRYRPVTLSYSAVVASSCSAAPTSSRQFGEARGNWGQTPPSLGSARRANLPALFAGVRGSGPQRIKPPKRHPTETQVGRVRAPALAQLHSYASRKRTDRPTDRGPALREGYGYQWSLHFAGGNDRPTDRPPPFARRRSPTFPTPAQSRRMLAGAECLSTSVSHFRPTRPGALRSQLRPTPIRRSGDSRVFTLSRRFCGVLQLVAAARRVEPSSECARRRARRRHFFVPTVAGHDT